MSKLAVRVILLAIFLASAVTCHAGTKSRLVTRLESGDEQTLVKDYYQMYRNVAKARELLLIDHYPHWETILEDKDLFDTYVPDGIHPGPEGCQSVITPEIIRVLGIGSAGESPLRPSNQATLVIDTDAASTPYDRMIFGGFIEHFGKQIYGGVFEPGSPLADEAGFRMDVIAALKELKVPVIRWPGGCFVDGYHWRDGVGDRREPRDDIRWGVIEPHTFGTHEFVEFCRRLGAEPYICHNGLASVQEMIDWVEYCNGRDGPFASLRIKNGQADPFDVTFWSVGNEREGQAYIHKVRDGARGMKQVDPSVLVTCSGTHSESRVSPYLLEVASEHLDYLSVHNYWIRNFQTHQTPDYLSCIMLSERPQVYINRVCDVLDQAGLRGRIKLAFDEWNLRSWHHPGFQRQEKVDYKDPEIIQLIKARDKSLDPALYTMADALFAASFLNACLRHANDVGMANIAPLVNQTGPLYVHPRGIVRRSHFHTMAMYANQLESRVGSVHVTADTLTQGKDSVAVVDAIATVDASGKAWAIAMVNRHPSDSVACTVRMKGMRLEGPYNATVLTGDSPDAYNDIEHPNQVVPKAMKVTFSQGVTQLPAHSLIIMQVSTRKTP
ncbi:MAG: alpha-N-arabinofuranosidase [Planctomycetes bacterium]|nr:alpha-N-arabinofuranosidase [Planctomycetota bacterium]